MRWNTRFDQHRFLHLIDPEIDPSLYVLYGNTKDCYYYNCYWGLLDITGTILRFFSESDNVYDIILFINYNGEIKYAKPSMYDIARTLMDGTSQDPLQGSRTGEQRRARTPSQKSTISDNTFNTHREEVMGSLDGTNVSNAFGRLTRLIEQDKYKACVTFHNIDGWLDPEISNQATQDAIKLIKYRWIGLNNKNRIFFVVDSEERIYHILPREFREHYWKSLKIGFPHKEEIESAFRRIALRNEIEFINLRKISSRLAEMRKPLQHECSRILHKLRKNKVQTLNYHDFFPMPLKKKEKLDNILGALNGMVGIEKVKKKIMAILSRMELISAEIETSGTINEFSTHFMFTGSPGTGKTEVGRIIGEFFYAAGIRNKEFFEEIQASRLIASTNEGQTRQNVRELFERARGGVIFIDEIYTLKDDAFGQAAIDEFVALMENLRNDVTVIIAGYRDELLQFMDKNPGISSRIPEQNRIEFPDYTIDELFEILKLMLKKESFNIENDLEQSLKLHLNRRANARDSGNARMVRNFMELLVERYSERIISDGQKVSSRRKKITSYDLPPVFKIDEEELKRAFGELEALVGLNMVKNQIRMLEKQIRYDIERVLNGSRGFRFPKASNMAFLGRPGTGKTTVARIMGKILYALGLLEEPRITLASRKELVAEYVGQTAKKTSEVLRSSLGGLLFIDEAYSLSNAGTHDFGSEAISTIVDAITRPEFSGLTIIFAGYSYEMHVFFQVNPGLTRRVPVVLIFEDYSVDECMIGFRSMLKRDGFNIESAAELAVRERIEAESLFPEFSNMGSVEILYGKSIARMKARVVDNGLQKKAAITIIAEDISS